MEYRKSFAVHVVEISEKNVVFFTFLSDLSLNMMCLYLIFCGTLKRKITFDLT